MPPFKQNVGRLLNVDRESQQELGKILRRESSHCLTGTTKSANTKRGPHCHNALASNQIPDTTPDEGSDTRLKNYPGQVPKGLHAFPFLTSGHSTWLP